MRQFVRPGLIASIVVGIAAVAGAQAPKASPPAPAQSQGAAAKAQGPAQPSARPAILDRVLATVNGEPITGEDFLRLIAQTGVPPGEDEPGIYKLELEQLVNVRLITQFLKAQKALVVSEADVDKEFANFEKMLKQDGQDVNVALAQVGVTIPQVREEMRNKLRWDKYTEAVSTKANLDKFLADNKELFDRTQVRASHIVVLIRADATPAEKEAARQKLASIKAEIDSNKITFADAANKYSEDPGNKSSPCGGDLGYFIRQGLEPKFTAAAFALKKGVVSDPVETPFGYHLILVTDMKEGTPIDPKQQELLVRRQYTADVQLRIIAAQKKTAKIDIKPMPADLFPKDFRPGGVPTGPGGPVGPGAGPSPK